MKKILKLILVFSALFNLSIGFCEPKFEATYQIKDYIKKLGKRTLAKTLRAFVESGGKSRMVGEPGHQSAKLHIEQYLKKHGDMGKTEVKSFTPQVNIAKKSYLDDFQKKIVGQFKSSSPTFKKWRKFTDYMVKTLDGYKNIKGQNIIWEKKGSSAKDVILITAHWDTISHNKDTFEINFGQKMPGADYNGSGVAIALSLINRFNVMPLLKTVRVVFLDYQGLGFLGAHEYAQSLKDKGERIAGVVNLEMLGHDSQFFDKTKKKYNMAVYSRNPNLDKKGYDQDLKVISIFERYNKKCRSSVDFELRPNGFDSSDHAIFWKYNYPAIVFTQDWENDFNNKGYQSSNDFVETINQSTFYNAYLYLACSLSHWALDI